MKRFYFVLFLISFFQITCLFSEENGVEEELNLDIELSDLKLDEQKNGGDSKTGASSPESKTYLFQGKLLAFLGIGIKTPNSYSLNYDRIQLEMNQIYKNIIFKLKANARYNKFYENQLNPLTGENVDGYRRGENFRLDIPEASVNCEYLPDSLLNQFNLIIGIQTVNWGKADEFRPTDILSPQDTTTQFIEDRNDRKFGKFGVKTVFTFTDTMRFETIWFPLQRTAEFTMDDQSPFSPPYYLGLLKQGYGMNAYKLPDQKVEHSDLAVKGYFQLFEIDFSLSFYNGYHPQPFIKISPDATSTAGYSMTPFLNRITMWGFDFEKAAGAGFVFRGESAYFSKGMLFGTGTDTSFPLYVKHGSNGYVEKKLVSNTLGFDKNDFLIQKLYLNIQYSFDYIFDYENGLYASGISADEINHLLIWAVNYEWFNSVFFLEFAGSYNLKEKDYFFNPNFRVKLGIETKLIVGGMFFGGNQNTNLGQFKEKDYGYIKLEHLF